MPDIPYDRPNRDRQYLSIAKHQRHSKNEYSKWINIQTERDAFDAADYGNHSDQSGDPAWLDDNGNLWGLLQHFETVGMGNEQFGFFYNPQNVNLPWHGHPVFPFKRDKGSKKYDISENLITLWMERNLIDDDDYINLVKGKRL